ncbi:MAG: DUF4145 domain-containing protein [Nitrospira sp.]|nr:MAG: DUF4145 domain-containing protein [Nitrospira sp.]
MQLPDPTRRFICRTCQRETGHWPIAHGPVKGSEKLLLGQETSSQIFQVVQCRDCKSTTYCLDTRVHPGHMMGDSYVERTDYFPPLQVRTRPDWFSQLPEGYQSILAEVYQAIDNSLFFLASTGTRTAVDQLIVEKIGDAGRFEDKIIELVERKIIDNTQGEMLLALINAGSASAHRSYKPDSETINHMMDILEAIFYSLLIEPDKRKDLERKAAEIRKSTPPRKPARES